MIQWLIWVSLIGVSQTSTDSGQRVIVIDSGAKPQEPAKNQVFVESGSSVIVSLPNENMRSAYRDWEEKCAAWKKELKQNNGKNLLIASCGQANRRTEKIQLTTFYVIESKADYKIKVGCD
jgi:hypothetical protein